MMKRSLVLATRNRHKANEISSILGPQWTVLTAQDIDENITWLEDGETFEQNALKKIEAIARLTNLPVLADDSGLCVEALSGKPGVHSSSFGGTEGNHAANNARLLRELDGVLNRKAYFVCTLILQDDQKRRHVFVGEVHGNIGTSLAGKNGFGYDPFFTPIGYTVTMAELSEDEKNKISHRGQAMKKLKAHLGC